jgi:hypothetical protein
MMNKRALDPSYNPLPDSTIDTSDNLMDKNAIGG